MIKWLIKLWLLKVLEKKNVELKMVKVKQDIECINGRVILLETWNKKKN